MKNDAIDECDLDIEQIPVRRIIQDVRSGVLCIPEFQRGYVWKPAKAAKLLDSLYRKLPVGSLLVWQTVEKVVERQGQIFGVRRPGSGVRWLIDGQQRARTLDMIQSLDDSSCQSLEIHFNPVDGAFARANAALRKDPKWVRLAELWDGEYRRVRNDLRDRFPRSAEKIEVNIDRCRAILDYEIPVIVMRDHRFADALDAFKRLNTAGVRLRGDDVRVADIAGRHSGFIRDNVVPKMEELRRSGFDRLSVSHLFASCAALAQPGKPGDITTLDSADLKRAWSATMRGLERVRHLVGSEFGLRSMSLLWSGSLLVPPIVLSASSSPRDRDAKELAAWMALAALGHRYSGSSETALDQDLKAATSPEPVQQLIRNISKQRRRLTADEADFDAHIQDRGALFATYVASRHMGAKDLLTRQKIEESDAGATRIDRHHIVPRATFSPELRRSSDNVANIAFILRDSNASLGKDAPALALSRTRPDILRSQCIPETPTLWEEGNHEHLWAERRSLLARAFNEFVAPALEKTRGRARA